MNTYHAIGYTCDGTESELAECTIRGSICAPDSQHAVAISCGAGGSSGTVVKAMWCMILKRTFIVINLQILNPHVFTVGLLTLVACAMKLM